MKNSPQLDDLIKKARLWYDSLTPEEKLDHDADQAVSFAYHCAKEFRKNGGTYQEFVEKYRDGLRAKYLKMKKDGS